MQFIDNYVRELELRRRWFALVAADLQKTWHAHQRIYSLACHHYEDLRACSERTRTHLAGSWQLLRREGPRDVN